MVRVQRLISTTMMITSCAISFLSVCSLCSSSSHEDISRNLVRDPVELGNPYPVNRGSHYHDSKPSKRNHPNHPQRRPNVSTPPSPSSEESRHTQSHADAFPKGEGQHSESGSAHPFSSVSTEDSDEDCPECAAARQNAKATSGLDEETLKAVRVEIVKQRILKKLRLKEPPQMEHVPKSHNTVLPQIALGNPVLSNAVRNDDDYDIGNMDLEDFYGKTEQIIVLPQEVLPGCTSWGSRSEAASCLVFNLPNEVMSNRISSAEMWVYKLSDMSTEDVPEYDHEGHNTHNFSISEIVTVASSRSSKRRSNIYFNAIASRNDVPETSDWISFNITDKAHKWLATQNHEHTIKISCSTCSQDPNEFPFDTVGDQQPFIVFNIANGKRKRRSRRSIDCSPGITECCREYLHISFEEIKWDWVLQPKGFDAYYCKGKCHGDAALAHTATRHSGIMIDYVKTRGGVNNKTIDLVPCCTATEMKPITLLYRDPQTPNSTVIQKVMLPNMVVKSCGCK